MKTLSNSMDDVISRLAALKIPEHLQAKLEEAGYAVACFEDECAMGIGAAASDHGGLTHSVLEDLLEMELESSLPKGAASLRDYADMGVTPEIDRASAAYEKAAEELLEKLFGPDVAQEAVNAEAPYLMFMTQEGHGVGVWDGSLDHVEGLDVKVLREAMNRAMGYEYKQLKDSLSEAANTAIADTAEMIATALADAVESAVEERLEAETEASNGDNYWPDGIEGDLQYQHSGVRGLAKSRDSDVEDIAELVQEALDSGMDEDKIVSALEKAGEPEYQDGFHSVKHGIVSTPQIGDVDVQLDLSDMDVELDGSSIKGNRAYEIVDALRDDLSDRLLDRIGKAEHGEIHHVGNVDGYWAFVVDPKKLKSLLGG